MNKIRLNAYSYADHNKNVLKREKNIFIQLQTWDHEQNMLSLLKRASSLPIESDHHKHQSLAVEWDPADEEGNHHTHWEKEGII